MRLISSIVCAILAIFGNGVCDDFKIVQTSDGAVRGVRNTTSWQKVDYYSFKGIPYAEPPTGELRFKVIIFRWVHYPKCCLLLCFYFIHFRHQSQRNHGHQILDASDFGNICLQIGEFLPTSYPQSEDCLFLNIYVPGNRTHSNN